MNKQEQRIAIAEACGYRNIALREDPDEGFGPLLTGFKNDNQFDEQIPDYLNSLNAMHKAEKIFDHALYCRYINELCDVTIKGNNSMYMATAVQRAEAFLKTLNLWKHE
jgi:hypothetical protein